MFFLWLNFLNLPPFHFLFYLVFILFGKSSKENKKVKRKNEPVKGQTNPSMTFPHPFSSFSLFLKPLHFTLPGSAHLVFHCQRYFLSPSIFSPIRIPAMINREPVTLLALADGSGQNSLWSICNFFFSLYWWVQFYDFFYYYYTDESSSMIFFLLSYQTLL